MFQKRYSNIEIDSQSQVPPPPRCPASKMTWYLGANNEDRYFSDRGFRSAIFIKYPKRYSIELANMYIEIYETEGRFMANCSLRFWDSLLNSINLELALSESKLKEKAEELAFKCRYFALNFEYSKSRIRILNLIANDQGIKLPKKDEIGILNRLSDELWWRRNLRKKHRRGLEKAALTLNLVNQKKSPYISNESFNCYLNQKNRISELLDSIKAVNELNQEFRLSELVEKSLSNPKNRRSELMVRISGMEEYAQERQHVGVLYTITCPSRMHCSLSKSGERNPKYDNSTPKQAQKYLNRLWARIRAKINRKNLKPYGLRVVEPHHDGTPHWHVLLFMDKREMKEISSILRDYALEDSPNEPGAQKRRFTAMTIDWNRGTATGYVAKYISKNIDGFGIEIDTYGNEAKSSANRITAWASTWGIRQFQFIGGPIVSVWRELRRITPESLPNNLIKTCCEAADSNNWYQYMNLMGGHISKTGKAPITLLKVWSDHLGKYGEALGDVIKGLVYEGASYISRVHTWTIQGIDNKSGREKLLTIGNGSMVHEVERPLLGAAREGVPAETMRTRAPMSKTFIPLEFCQ